MGKIFDKQKPLSTKECAKQIEELCDEWQQLEVFNNEVQVMSKGSTEEHTEEMEKLITGAPFPGLSALDTQHGGDHYKKLGHYQPWEVLQAWLTPEEFRGYMKGTAIAYLAREQDKGGDLDIEKGAHTLEAWLEMVKEVAMAEASCGVKAPKRVEEL